MQANVFDIRQRLAAKTAEFLMDENVKMTEAELNARLSVFPDDHVDNIVAECRRLKGVA